MAALQGLNGLYSDPQDTGDIMDEGVLEAKANDPDPEHGSYGSQSDGYSGTIPASQPYGPSEVYDGWQDNHDFSGRGYRITGEEIDKTPTTHASPYPRGIIQSGIASMSTPGGLEIVGEQMCELHGPDLGGPRFFNADDPAGHENPTHYTTDRYDAPNDNYLSSDVPGQLRGAGSNGVGASGHGNADTTQGYGVLNSIPEFQMGHSIRRVQHDSVHFDYTNTHGEQNVPFPGRHPVQQMPLDGPDSPYFNAGSIDGANIVWEGRIGDPSPYMQSPEPTIGPPPASNDVFAWGG